MVGIVNNTLLKVVGSKVVHHSTFKTALCQVKDVVNSRPLTYSSPDKILEPLTLNSFLRPANSATMDININPRTLSSNASTLLTGYKALRRFMEHFKSQFYSRYLGFLRKNCEFIKKI